LECSRETSLLEGATAEEKEPDKENGKDGRPCAGRIARRESGYDEGTNDAAEEERRCPEAQKMASVVAVWTGHDAISCTA
jgi:hypothetical protein